jgi:hypothetical protein
MRIADVISTATSQQSGSNNWATHQRRETLAAYLAADDSSEYVERVLELASRTGVSGVKPNTLALTRLIVLTYYVFVLYAIGTMFATNCITSLCIAASLGAAGPALPGTGHVQAVRSFMIILNAPPDIAIRPFGALAEQGWDPDWHPHFVFPTEPKDCEGAVFTIDQRGVQTWLLQTWDMQNHIVRYIAFDPGVKLTEITIRVSAQGARSSQAVVTYRRTGLSSAGDEQVRHFAQLFTQEGPHWEAAINGYLERSHS